MQLIKLRDEDVQEFKRLMQETFQYGYESVCGKAKEQVLPENEQDVIFQEDGGMFEFEKVMK